MAKYVEIKGDRKSFESMSIIIPREKWHIVTGERKPMIECPYCGGGLLGDVAPHKIYPDGSVKGSVVCEHRTKGKECNFHAYVKLEGWKGGFIQ